MEILQWIGGIFYLLNKIFLSLSEHAKNRGEKRSSREWRVVSWGVYLIGLPAWVIVFVGWHNWIAASVEACGAPAMILGLVTAFRGETKDSPHWLNYIAIVCVPFGFGCSLYDFGGITTVNQWLEIGLVIGFLVGTYSLAKERASGYLWYILMHVTCGWLMWIQDYPWLFVQQLLSLFFIVDAYVASRKKQNL